MRSGGCGGADARRTAAVSAARCLPAARVRLGMVLADGREVVEVVRPDRATVRRGYGRVWLGFADGTGWRYYPTDVVTLHPDDDNPPDPTMDDWPGRWWPLEVAS